MFSLSLVVVDFIDRNENKRAERQKEHTAVKSYKYRKHLICTKYHMLPLILWSGLVHAHRRQRRRRRIEPLYRVDHKKRPKFSALERTHVVSLKAKLLLQSAPQPPHL